MDGRFAISAALIALAACKPPAAEDYVARVELDEARMYASEPIPSPDTEGALWAESDRPGRILYGKPGEAPLMALACEEGDDGQRIHVTRFAAADPEAKGILALIGNGHVTRLHVDATWNGRAWLWEGYAAADDPDLDVLTGRRRVEATVPGAGSVELNPSERPRHLIETCRGERSPDEPVPPEPE
ncbi:hypothetical protein [Altererythrobacter sp. C41]|uniref:hypothetical protein n=1 Tax=Altererythrobacter sp. C41 TaxID=2806021 RepID=UPI001933405E|nr:hypothetical protein [Altererythrobacter sp. C41]MBM0170210.1 hypothetical protein [Altererythrobacter sp. C41]